MMALLLAYGADPMLPVEQDGEKTLTVLDTAVERDYEGLLVYQLVECPRTDLRGQSPEWLQQAYDIMRISG